MLELDFKLLTALAPKIKQETIASSFTKKYPSCRLKFKLQFINVIN